ncbi:RraA family protein [Arthrobacter bambusae]|uniref:RraA family protein n=1 Tax=Arthrobacter bambusae TaxID=1338426 RepID=UPI001F511A96|nr:RraA family protein [Arthrobacter bambusae]MCI0144082.1 RraA family protein [Arthrobacter bambusae]
MTVGFRVLPRSRKVDSATVQRYSDLPVANVSDVMSRMTAAGSRLRPLHACGRLAGPALTVRVRPGDNLMLHMALNLAEPGDVIVVDAGGDLTNAIFGEMMLRSAQMRGVAGLVIDGAVRDLAVISAGDFPVYAAGVTHRGPYKDGPGEINIPVSINGMVVEPGDLVIGDEDGLLCVPFDELETVLLGAQAKHRAELLSLAKIEAGTDDRTHWETRLRDLGCEFPITANSQNQPA